MIYAGIDAGSRTVKAAVVDEAKTFLGAGISSQGVNQPGIAQTLLKSLLKDIGFDISSVAGITATGYSRDVMVFADSTKSEITCHARGVTHFHPQAKTVIDIGGQDSKIIYLDTRGQIVDFVMNDRCAAGTGRFLEMVAARLELKLSDFGHVASKSDSHVEVNSTCAVFAETEIVGLLAAGHTPAEIAAGVQLSISRRIYSMTSGRINDPVYFVGGVAMIKGIREALENSFKMSVTISSQPQVTGAIGAALLAYEEDYDSNLT